MYCEQCGKLNEDNRKYCYACGSPLTVIRPEKKTGKTSGNEAGSASRNRGRAGTSDHGKKRVSASEELRTEAKKEENRERKDRSRSAAEAELSAMEQELRQLDSARSPILALIGALLVLAAVLVVLVIRIPQLYGAKQDAAAFQEALLSGGWEKAYGCLYMEGEDSPFLTEEMFVKVMTRTGAGGFRNLQVEEISSTEEQKVFSAVYEDSEGSHTGSVVMCPTGKKKLLFLKEWKVDPVTVTVSDVTVAIPSEAKLLLNGGEPESEGVLKEAEHAREYTFDRLFAGIWEAELQAENRASYREDVQVDGESRNISLTGAELYPDQELMDQVLGQFVRDYGAILEASVNREDFSTVEQYFTSEAVQDGRARNMYANACSQAYDPETGAGILSYELSDISAEFVPTVKSGYARTGDLVMQVQSTMSYTYTDGDVEKSDTQTSVGLLCYHQENGQWKIQSFS